MKKISPKYKRRLLRLARYRLNEKLKRGLDKYLPKGRRFVSPGDYILAPENISIAGEDGVQLLKLIYAVSNAVLEKKLNVTISFKNTREFSASGAIILLSELDRIISSSNLAKPLTIQNPIYRKPREVMKQLGFHELTGDVCNIIPEREDVVYWKATKGGSQSGELYGELVEAIAERANKEAAKHIEVNRLWRSVNEAIANSIDHAYKKPRKDGFNGLPRTKWWMLSQIKDGYFTMAVCDLGCGYKNTINETLPEGWIAKFRSTVLGHNEDSLAIETAMEYGRSGTHQGHRGKGSRDVLSLLEKHGSGELIVLSNSGLMKYEYEKGIEKTKKSSSLKIPIGGTVVWWKLPLREVGSEAN